MTQIVGDGSFSEWVSLSDPSALIDITDGILTVAAPAGVSGRMRKFINVFPGETVEFTVLGRHASGTDSGGIAFDYRPTSLTGNNNVTGRLAIESAHWKEYRLRWSVPADAGSGELLAITIGSFGPQDATVEFARPMITIDNSVLGTARVICMGLIQLTNPPVVADNFASAGIRSVTINNELIEIYIPALNNINSARNRPIFTATMTCNGNGLYQPVIGRYSTAGFVRLGLRSTQTGDYLNPPVLASNYVNVMGWIA